MKIELEAKLFKPQWIHRIIIYALDRSTIGFSSESIGEWTKQAWRYDIVRGVKKGNKIEIELPQDYFDFYSFTQIGISIKYSLSYSCDGDSGLLIVEDI